MQVHLAEADRVGLGVALSDRWDRLDIAHLRHSGQCTDRNLNGLAEVRGVHRLSDVHGTEVARDVLADVRVAQVSVVGRGFGDLEDLRAQVGHRDLALDRVRLVDRVFKHDVWVTRLELQLRQGLEELASVDLVLADPLVINHLVVLLRDADFGERLTVDALNIVRREQVHVFVALSEVERDVRDHDAERQRLNADLLVSVFTLRVKEAVNVWVVCMQVDRTCALTCTKLVRVGEGVFQKLHDRDDTGGLVLDLLDRCSVLTQVGEVECHTAATLGELQRRVHAASDGLHVVLNTEQEAGYELTALSLTRVQEGWGCRLEATLNDFLNQGLRELLVATCQVKRNHAHAVFEALKVSSTVERFQRV